MNDPPILNALTIDVEDYYQVSAFEKLCPRNQWDQMPSRVEASTRRLLTLFEECQVQATFFILGWTARKFPHLVREIHAAGHELGCHSFWHRLVYRQTPRQFRSDLRQARLAIEDAAGQPVFAYRAPSFSITRRSWWALEILAEEGFKVDSSIFPIRHDRYGVPEASPVPHPIATPAGTIWEFPLATVGRGRWRLPVSGGGYFRLYPLAVTQAALRWINRKKTPFVFYLHPWEIDPEQPVVAGASRRALWRHRVGLHRTLPRLKSLLASFRFGTLTQAMQPFRPVEPSPLHGHDAPKGESRSPRQPLVAGYPQP